MLITISRRENIYLSHCWDAIPRNALYAYRGFGGSCSPIFWFPCVSNKTNINTVFFAFLYNVCERVRESARECETDFRCSNGSYNKTNEMTPISQIYFWNRTLQGTAVAQWLRCCATNQKVTGSIPACVIGIFH